LGSFKPFLLARFRESGNLSIQNFAKILQEYDKLTFYLKNNFNE